ncbi:Kynureninase 2 [Ceratocystis lukuohia]|uniref:Kynureninase n=1 Tax=Ceratocystis lukuohia TaxID=2019550 RepID=A0ABR4MID4_9PEZI
MELFTRDKAQSLDDADSLGFMRDEFIIPTRDEIASKKLPAAAFTDSAEYGSAPKSVYLVGNSLGLQPRRTRERISQYLDTWRTQGVQGHFKPLEGSPLPTWLDVDDRAAEMIAPIVGAKVDEVAVMQTLTANLHFLLCAFYRPQKDGRHKILLESKAFPSDHFTVETQIRHHGLDTKTSMVCIEPATGGHVLTTEHILDTIAKHASDTAILLLPGVQFYTGEFLDIAAITAAARGQGIFVIWDLAHAVGNVPLQLHEWGVDAAAWCTYKYLNSGPGCIGGLFVHEHNASVSTEAHSEDAPSGYVNRLAGWWANHKPTRFGMVNNFHPAAGARGFQLSNPSVLDITSLCASLEVFKLAGGMGPLRQKSLLLTNYLETLLDNAVEEQLRGLYTILTPRDPERRGAQLSILLSDGLLDAVMASLESEGVLVDDRKPNVIRVAPTPLYNRFTDCFDFVEAFKRALISASSPPA